jgi:hypothetical protein
MPVANTVYITGLIMIILGVLLFLFLAVICLWVIISDYISPDIKISWKRRNKA